MTSSAPKLATYEDLLTLPEGVRAEVLRGALVSLPSPRPRHANVQRALGRFVGGPFHDDDGHGGPGGWWIFAEVDVALGAHDIVRPDLLGIRRERMPEPDQRPIVIVPDWVCEVISPSSEQIDRALKKRLYAEHGVAHYWIVDPEARTLEALELRDGQWVDVGSHGDGERARVPPFEAVELDVTRLFLPKASAPPDAG